MTASWIYAVQADGPSISAHFAKLPCASQHSSTFIFQPCSSQGIDMSAEPICVSQPSLEMRYAPNRTVWLQP